MARQDEQKRTRPTSSSRTSRSATGSNSRSQSSQRVQRNSQSTQRSSASKSSSAKRSSQPVGKRQSRPLPNDTAKRRSTSLSKKSSKPKNSASSIDLKSVKDTAKSTASSAGSFLLNHRPVLIGVIIVAVLLVGGLFDAVSNNGKAFGGVTIGGIDVGGKTKEEMRELLEQQFGSRIEGTTVYVHVDDQAQAVARDPMANVSDAIDDEWYEEDEDEDSPDRTWTFIPTDLGVYIPYDEEIENAMNVGRSDGGIFKRISLIFAPSDIPVETSFYEPAFKYACDLIDEAIGDERIDASVDISWGDAEPTQPHDGLRMDRDGMRKAISDAMISEEKQAEYILTILDDPSRTTYEQAQELASKLNALMDDGAFFTYFGKSWTAYSYDLGDWIDVKVAEDGTYVLTLDEDYAATRIINGVGAYVTANDVKVHMTKSDDVVYVATEGSAMIPEVGLAIHDLQDKLFGPEGRINDPYGDYGQIHIDITQSSAPESLTLSEAVDLGIITVLGEYTTYYSDYEGTEHRNHNIHIAADLINNSVVKSDEEWSFNETTGDSNDPNVFDAAGSIVEGEYIDSIGGGICQVATTVFNALYESGMWITTRMNHTLYISGYPDGRDATVSYPDLDLRFRNALDSDVALVTSYTNDSVTCKVYGVRTGYQVYTEVGEWHDGPTKYGTQFEVDEDLADGYYYLKTKGADSSWIEVTRTVIDESGELVSSQTFRSNYDSNDEIYVVGPNTNTDNLKRKVSDDDKS